MEFWNYISNIGIKKEDQRSQIWNEQLINRLIFIASLIAVAYIPLLAWLKAYYMVIQLSLLFLFIIAFFFTSSKIKMQIATPAIAVFALYHMTTVSVYIQGSQLELYIILIALIQFSIVKKNIISFSIFVLAILCYFVSLYLQDTISSTIVMNDIQKITMIALNSLGIFIGGLYLIFQVLNSNNKYRRDLVKERERVIKKNEKINAQVKIIEVAHKAITDSINYSKRIQNAILPSDSRIKSILPDSFVLYKPKDIVAGDFYWVDDSEEYKFFAVADCTGHGVPGAMMSVICNNLINRSVREFNLTKPNEILDKTRELIIAKLGSSKNSVKDGMDIAFCSLKDNILNYAGANIKLYIIRKGEILEYKADKQPIGMHLSNNITYTNNEIELLKGDTIYLISDGYVDQFGGKKVKKFKSFALKKLLKTIQPYTMEEQKQVLNSTFEDWKGNLDQIDDVCIMGVRINE